ncbi:hypothetical protein GR702_05495 [Novosphingobium sp. FGD1]|uniref:XRE family transcriptional regulator n=1 Tax=Novosphingobium silvae TaxID=2692619 RepID=A0A7X4K6J0_9SPHN|nr:hypothetical protein [Novosphingobium silvae]MYL97225.1 hypothetical protein [Novosphingobium silvae]
MSEIESLFAERKRVSAIAREIRAPVGTVWAWKKNGAIPPWRRPSVLAAVNRLGIDVPAETIAYLATGL